MNRPRHTADEQDYLELTRRIRRLSKLFGPESSLAIPPAEILTGLDQLIAQAEGVQPEAADAAVAAVVAPAGDWNNSLDLLRPISDLFPGPKRTPLQNDALGRLANEEIRTLDQLVRYSRVELLDIGWFGTKKADLIEAALRDHGLALLPAKPPASPEGAS